MDNFEKITTTVLNAVTTPFAHTNEENSIYKNTETPKYKITEKNGPIEIREYNPMIVAQVTVDGDPKQAANQGFWILANYIFGKNVSEQKVEMTSPVVQKKGQKIEMTSPVRQTAKDSSWVIQFVMPSKFSLDSLPKALDERISFHTIKPSRQAVIRFSGLATKRAIEEKTDSLITFLRAHNITAKSEPSLYFYDSPFTLPWDRRNEVAIEI
jgi:D-alanyl-D-alanine carboxypeptidase